MPYTAQSERSVDIAGITVTEEHGDAITQGALAPHSPCRITVLTDRATGAQIRMDDAMLSVFLATLPHLGLLLPDHIIR